MASSLSSSGSGSPCGACKFLRRKCVPDCIFAPYFCTDQGPALFAAVHKVFGASNVSKLLLHVPVADRYEAVVTIAYEAQARIRDPVYGCVAHIFALQQQVACLQAQLMQAKAQLAQNLSRNSINEVHDNQWQANSICHGDGVPSVSVSNYPTSSYINYPISPQSSLESIDQYMSNDHGALLNLQHKQQEGLLCQSNCAMKRACSSSSTDWGELQELALRMMRN